MKIMFAGDSWAIRAFTETNHDRLGNFCYPGDKRLADYWDIEYFPCFAGGQGNLVILDKLKSVVADNIPIIWIYTEPGRDYGRITGKPEFDWISSEDIFSIRRELDAIILKEIRAGLDNPIGLIGGLSDVDKTLAESIGLTVLDSSWQKWIAKRLNRSEYIDFGWGAADIGWRMHTNNVKPSKAAAFAWDKLVKEWIIWEESGYFYRDHPNLRANEEYARDLKIKVLEWCDEQI